MKPIIFSTEMVRAILDGRKTQTRRVIKPQPNGEIKANIPYEFYGSKTERIFTDTKAYLAPYSVGDVLWVRETWRCIKYDSMDGNLSYGVKFKDGEQEHFEFDDNERFHQFGKYAFKNGWQSPYYMPREAARLFLLVKAVRVERLQEIAEADAIAEGAETVRDNFMHIWNRLNARRGHGWDTNPWVWVIEFERTEAPS